MFLLPALVLLSLFVVWPLLRAFWWSLNATDLLALPRQHWLGGAQYSAVLRDERFRQAFANTALFALLVVPVQTALACFLALWVTRPEREWRWLRAVFVLPTMVAMPALAVVWTALYQPSESGQSGPINALLTAFGMAPHAWLREPQLALPALALMSVWQGVGLQLMVFVSALQALPRELLEAARLDGANGWQRTWFVTLPALRNTIVFLLSVTTILAFRLFVQPYLMTRGGPMDSTLSLIQLIYDTTFVAQDLGLASAGAFLFLLTVLLLTLVQRWALREERT
ncbi:MAG TPA: sugar ABC transporter permease [Polyangiaceae bacterium]|nr:sugar ABC transporter permease [Polyangiaceae bacterium]